MKKIWLILFFMAAALRGWCQKDSVAAHPFITHFQLRQSFETSDEPQSPAELQFTLPGSGKDSWLIDAAAAFTLPGLSSGSVTSKFVAEYHRNTALDNPQNNYQAGYNLRWFQRGDMDFKLVLTGNVKYVRNVQDTTQSLAITVNLGGYKRKGNGLKWSRPTYLHNERFTYQFNPYLAGEYQ